jgi:F-type H+-transporting ATPase subunit a
LAEAKHSPLAQFEIKTLLPIEIGDVDLSFTNSSLFMVLALVGICAFLLLGMRRRSLVPSRWQSMAELSYEFIANLIRDTVGSEGRRFFGFFVPPGVSVFMWPLLIPIEILSYFSRPISLSVRLFANMLAGHTLLKVFAGFVPALGAAGILPLAFVAALSGLEIVIAFLQAYVFAILTCLYINDALHMH